ncbi:Plasmodium variant antigen protein Cir/Yir/Bir, putative [Plasmodium chabaudi adami]|uniref:Plasmodium variant antigen protein Cir/Yir/Bir, putative n=1 Tax=Plasmodium chabaudi adami TaxID=5826 RepID=A0A1D3LC53_PLACE|nr:Plasmodium variant antigen protein Cir/Yir/Bir, putative [Plasmodium chabaudi adami]
MQLNLKYLNFRKDYTKKGDSIGFLCPKINKRNTKFFIKYIHFYNKLYQCKFFELLWTDFPDTLDNNENYQFKNDDTYVTYCSNDNCETDLDKINAWCLCFFNVIFGDSESINNHEKNNMNIVQYIIIWLSYMLSLKKDNTIKNLNDFYNEYIKENDKYNKEITDVESYTSYKDLIDKKNFFSNMNINDISKFYEAFKSLCNMHNEINQELPNCTNYYGNAKTFYEEYQNLLNDNDIGTEGSSYSQILSILSTDYDNLKSQCTEKCSLCTNVLPLPTTKTPQSFEHASSSSSILNTSIPGLSIFAIPVFLGVAYKYSLFGIDKLFQRQYSREKLKKIKRKMNHYM